MRLKEQDFSKVRNLGFLRNFGFFSGKKMRFFKFDNSGKLYVEKRMKRKLISLKTHFYASFTGL